METSIVVTKDEYQTLRDAFDVLADVLFAIEDETGWDDDDED